MSQGICKTHCFPDGRYGDSLSTFGGFGRFFGLHTRPEKGKRNRPIRVTVRKLKREKVLDIIREEVIAASEIPSRHGQGCITVEGVASQLRLEPAKVHWAFMVLNHEGWLSQGERGAPHDTWRSDYGQHGNDSSWRANHYYLMRQRTVKKNPCAEIPLPDNPLDTMSVWDECMGVPRPKKRRYSKRLQRRMT